MRDYFTVLPQHLLPQHLLSRCVYRLTRSRRRWLKDLLIRRYIRAYGVDMSEAEAASLDAFADFNAFFTRALKQGARPIAVEDDAIVSPADADVSQAGVIRDGVVLQAKGREFSVSALLGERDAGPFPGGRFVTLYLSPRNYHRVHMPLHGRLESIDYIPGRLFSVNAITTNRVEGLFARNERIVCRFATACGPMALCMVGALFVGSMETVSHGQITPASLRRPTRLDCNRPGALRDFQKGTEFARFNMGSTVILLFEDGAVEWEPWLAPGAKLRMGQKIGTFTSRP